MSTADAFAALDHAREQRRAAEVAEKIAILRAAELYEVKQHDIEEMWVEGLERWLHGKDGTPRIGEFLALELAGILGGSPDAALHEIWTVLDVRHRHPALWGAFLEGKVWFWQAAKVAERCGQLSAAAAGRVDRRIAHAMQLWPWSRIMHHLDAWIITADPGEAARRAEQARAARDVRISEISDGHCELYGRLAPADAIAFDQALDTLAGTLPVPELPGGLDYTDEEAARYRRGARRAAAVGALARQVFGQEALPVELVVHIDADDVTYGTGAARVQGWGDLLVSLLPEFLTGSTVIVKPVLDPAMIHALDGHEPSERMRLSAEVRNPVDVFPYGTRRAHACDMDHTEPYRFDGTRGQTGLHNLGPLSRRPHRAKTHGGWQLSQSKPGVFRWRSPAGYEYLVTAEGTVRTGAPPPRRVRDAPDEPDWRLDSAPDDPALRIPPSRESQAWALAQHQLTLFVG